MQEALESGAIKVQGRKGDLLAALAGAFVAMRWMTTLVLTRVLGADPQAGSAVRLGMTFVLLLVVWAVWSVDDRSGRPMLRGRRLGWVYAYVILCGISLLWSETASPAASAAYWLGTVADVMVAMLLLWRDDTGQRAETLMKGFVLGACVMALTAWAMPAQYDLRLGDEEYLNSNTIAYVCALGAWMTQWLMRGRASRWMPVLILLVVTVLRSLSKTTMLAFALSEAFLLTQDRSMSRRMKVALTACALVLVLLFWSLFVAYYDVYLRAGNQAETLTGRTGIWLWAWGAAWDRPWLGHGLDSMWKVAPRFGIFEARHAENELLQQFYALGVAGVVATAGAYGSLWRAIRRVCSGRRRVMLLSLLVFVLVRGLAEAEPFDLQLPLWMMVLTWALVGRDEAEEAAAQPVDAGVISWTPNVIRM